MTDRRPRDAGFTLLEMMAALVIFGVLVAFGTLGFRTWLRAAAVAGTNRQVIAELRNAQNRAVAEDTTYCVDFGTGATTTSWTLYRVPGLDSGTIPAGFSCASSGTKVDGPFRAQGGTYVTGVQFTQRDGSQTQWVLFYPRGAASPGSVQVKSSQNPSVYTISVDALTARVSSTGA